MAVRINQSKCDQCGHAKEPICVYICPGNLFYSGTKAPVQMRDARECWDCAACVKSCPKEAIEMFLPVQMGGKGAVVTARTKGQKVHWKCNWPNGKIEHFNILVKK
ncbi:MAG: 4Fe-4S dicluster domain-containing protein [Bacillota bacterium]|nr:4Fe-4S dicluster domain-containing protein [Bacillota bacterium]